MPIHVSKFTAASRGSPCDITTFLFLVHVLLTDRVVMEICANEDRVQLLRNVVLCLCAIRADTYMIGNVKLFCRKFMVHIGLTYVYMFTLC